MGNSMTHSCTVILRRTVPYLLIVLSILLPLAHVPAAFAADQRANPVPMPLDYAQPGGHFFTQANGAPLGQNPLGFAVEDAVGMSFWSGYQQIGGVPVLGYPISSRFLLDGSVVQGTQRALLQWQPASNSVALVNVFDRLHDLGRDGWLQSQFQVPPPIKLDEQGKVFAQIVQGRLALLDANPAIKARYYAAADPVGLFGLPTSTPIDFGPVVVLRAQRVVFQFWKVATPWA